MNNRNSSYHCEHDNPFSDLPMGLRNYRLQLVDMGCPDVFRVQDNPHQIITAIGCELGKLRWIDTLEIILDGTYPLHLRSC